MFKRIGKLFNNVFPSKLFNWSGIGELCFRTSNNPYYIVENPKKCKYNGSFK